ncbi:hypothetical protein O181_083775 [Austropuccinia psidii MF-1]|uniref:Integrase catalytic domain-containing protein n=1 Tax=Austropuccinia psidii MF-1 TaxID=1389203 RepID=A0A9Q3ILX1_9BASI|nr:hypothetical protein [Austropuccinia psidii MF-1]
MNTALLLWDRLIPHTALYRNIISDRDPKFTSALWTNLHRLFGNKLSFSTAYHPYELAFKYSDGFTHNWCTLIPTLELAYKTSVHSSTGQTPAMLEKGWNTRPPSDTLRKDSMAIHPTASSFKMILDKVKHH